MKKTPLILILATVLFFIISTAISDAAAVTTSGYIRPEQLNVRRPDGRLIRATCYDAGYERVNIMTINQLLHEYKMSKLGQTYQVHRFDCSSIAREFQIMAQRASLSDLNYNPAMPQRYAPAIGTITMSWTELDATTGQIVTKGHMAIIVVASDGVTYVVDPTSGMSAVPLRNYEHANHIYEVTF